MIDLSSKCQIIQGDCFDKLKEIPDKSIDLILTDPPYNLANYSTGNMKFDWRSEINNDVAKWDEKTLRPSDFVNEFKRIISPKGNIFIFCSYNLLGEYHKVFDPLFDTFQFLVWHKKNPVPNIRKSSFLNSCELIVCCWNKGHTWNFTTQNEMHNFIESPICMGRERIKDKTGKNLHPTQKPVSVLRKIIKIASNPNDIVLDCFSGVGSTGVAALEEGRRYIGIEIDKTYIEYTKERFNILF
ncbi:MAG: DNA methyltransferase [Phascolarctobacterium sp.]|nr:DNA methyltransferase [Phascolarctobacterium sp.]